MEKRWISVKATSEYLSIHEVTCRRLIDKDQIPASRIGRSVRVDFKRLEELMERGETR